MESRKMVDNLICKEKKTHTEMKHTDTKGGTGLGGGQDELGDWDWHIYTTDAMDKR